MSRPGAWEPGQSGNPNGRPRHSIRGELRRLASKKRPDGTTNAKAVAAKAWEKAAEGSLGAIQFLTDQLDGKVPDTLRLGNEGDEPVRFTIRIERAGRDDDADDGA